jgi:hypothetical protein
MVPTQDLVGLSPDSNDNLDQYLPENKKDGLFCFLANKKPRDGSPRPGFFGIR